MRPRKFEQLAMGDGAYYDPKASKGSIDHNYRNLFLTAVEKRTPEVLTDLRHDIWPIYEPIYWRTPFQPNEYWMYTLHPGLAMSWLANVKPPDWGPRALRALAPLKKSLLLWSERYRLPSDWMLTTALDTLLLWTIHESHPERIKHEAKMNRALSKLLGITQGRADAGKPQPEQGYSWNVVRRWYFPKLGDRQFTYSSWAGEDENGYGRRVLKDFRKHLDAYLVDLQNRAKELPRIPIVKRPERFEMLALYLCRGMTREQISETAFRKDPTVIYRDIRKAADLIGLKLDQPRR